ncbi:MAG: hypothetical protein ACE5EB_02570 [Thermodesulfobacteriota bacterium]
MKSLRIIVFLLVLLISAPALASDMSSGSMMGQGTMGHSQMSMSRMKEHHKMMRDMMGMIREMMVIMEGTPGIKDKDRADLKGMVKRMDEIMEKHKGMMKDMDMKGMKMMK